MAARRGLGNQDRLAIDSTHASATRTLVLAPCFLFGLTVGNTDMSATAQATFADVSASGDVAAETDKIAKIKLGPSGTTGGVGSFSKDFNPPVWVGRTLAVNITNCEVTVQYAPAS